MYKSQYANIQRKKLQITDEHKPLSDEIEDIMQRLDALSNEAESLGVSFKKNPNYVNGFIMPSLRALLLVYTLW